MHIVAMLIVGAAAGFLATRLMRIEADVPTTVAIGVLGAILGGLVLRALAVLGGWLGGFVGAVAGAMVLIWAWKALRGGRR